MVIFLSETPTIKTVEELAELSQAMCKGIVRLNSTEKGFTLWDDLERIFT